MKLLMLISDGMEECEALVTRDVLSRAGIEVFMASTNQKDFVISQNGLQVKADGPKIGSLDQFAGIILPGGGLGTKNLDQYKDIDSLLAYFVNSDKLVCAICAAPSVVGKRGYLRGCDFTCFSGFEKVIDGNHKTLPVVTSDNFITAKSMYYASDFGLAIIEKLLGKDKRNAIEKSIKSEL